MMVLFLIFLYFFWSPISVLFYFILFLSTIFVLFCTIFLTFFYFNERRPNKGPKEKLKRASLKGQRDQSREAHFYHNLREGDTLKQIEMYLFETPTSVDPKKRKL